jgi:hypothetical protein
MDIKKLIKKAICSACVYFTIITAVYMLCMLIITPSNESAPIEAERVLLFFVFSLLWAFADAIRSLKVINAILGRTIHFVICTFAFYSCFMLPVAMQGAKVLTGLVIFSLVYWITVALKAFFGARLKRNREHTEAYTGQFKKK